MNKMEQLLLMLMCISCAAVPVILHLKRKSINSLDLPMREFVPALIISLIILVANTILICVFHASALAASAVATAWLAFVYYPLAEFAERCDVFFFNTVAWLILIFYVISAVVFAVCLILKYIGVNLFT